MNFFFLLLLIPAIIKGIIVRNLEISPFFGAHFNLIFPDLIFCALVSFWLLKKNKTRATFPVLVYLAAFAGSLVWDYQVGYYVLKFFFPAILFLILNQENVEKITVRGVVSSAFFLALFPFIYILKLISLHLFAQPLEKSIEPQKEKSMGLKGPLTFAAIIGGCAGVFILALLTGLDPEFGKFLNFEELWKTFGDIILSGIYYSALLLWFFVIPIKTTWDLKEYDSSFLRLMQAAVMIVVAIIIGYSIYDAYILLRAFKLISLVYESMGKNTQLYFLELVFLGGGLMYTGSYFLSKLRTHEETNNHAHTMNIILILTLALLIPSVFNILRALLTVYIPAFGLTALRLFGINTVAAFVTAYIVILYVYFKKEKLLFVRSLLGFILPLIFLSFVLPNNLVVSNWHFSKYLEGKKADFDYFRKVKLEKWGGMFLLNMSNEKVQNSGNGLAASDYVWGLLLARETKYQKGEDFYKNHLITVFA